MAFKFIVFAAFVAITKASGIGYSAPGLAIGTHSSVSSYSTVQQHSPAIQAYAAPTVHAYAIPAVQAYAAPAVHAYAAPIAKTTIVEASAPANYDFGYAVNDPLTGDNKSQHESRRGDVVQGSYSLIESDGSKRTVEYSADSHNGFNAVVHKESAVVAVKAVAPVVAKVATPVSYAAPSVAVKALAPVVAKVATPVAAPSVAVNAVAPVVTKVATPIAYAAPVAHVSSLIQGAVAYGYAVPSLAHGYAAPSLAYRYATPSLAHGYAAPNLAYGYATPSLAHGYAVPSLAHGYATYGSVVPQNVW